MQYDFEKATRLVVKYAVYIQLKEKITIIGTTYALSLVQILFREVFGVRKLKCSPEFCLGLPDGSFVDHGR